MNCKLAPDAGVRFFTGVINNIYKKNDRYRCDVSFEFSFDEPIGVVEIENTLIDIEHSLKMSVSNSRVKNAYSRIKHSR